MQEYFKQLLSSCVQYIEFGIKRQDDNKKICKAVILDQYDRMSNEEKIKLYKWIYNFYDNNPKLYVIIMSALFFVTNDKICVTEIIQYVTNDKMELFDSMIVVNQLLNCLSINAKANEKNEYRNLRVLHKNLLDRFEALINVEYNYTRLENRNKNRIVIVTQQLLGDLHAPTRIVKEICSLLQKQLGFEVLLIVAIDEIDPKKIKENWTMPSICSYIKEYNGNFLIEHNNEKIQGYQFIVNEDNLEIMKNLVLEVCEMKPLFVWSLGDCFLFADQFRRYTTLVTQRFSNGCPITEGPILLDYLNFQLNNDTKMVLQEMNQKYIHMLLTLPIIESDKIYTRSDFDIPENAFVISVIGNRLDQEITEEFLNVINTVSHNDKMENIHFVFIGTFENYNSVVSNTILEHKSSYIGFQNDLLAVIKITDLFLNPPRTGGGNGGLWSLYQGVPVITLDNCDIASCAGADFICNNLNEMVVLVNKYVEDKGFYSKQSEIAYQVAREYADLASELKKVINKIVELS